MKTHSRFKITACLILCLLLAACGGLPKEVKQRADALKSQFKTTKKTIAENREKFPKLTASPEFEPFLRYSDRENWVTSFDQAELELERARKLYEKDLLPLVKLNDETRAHSVITQVGRVQQALKRAVKTSRHPYDRYDQLQNTIKNADTIHQSAQSRSNQISEQVARLAEDPAAKAKKEFPNSVANIDAKLAPFLKIEREAAAAAKVIQTQYAAHQDGTDTDYAAMTDSDVVLTRAVQTLEKSDPKFRKEVKGLYSSYTKILQDMKAEYTITVTRESWDNYSDYYSPSIVSFKRQVSPELYEFFDTTTIDTIAELRPYFKSHIGNRWDQLQINPKANWTKRAHDWAVFWVNDSREKYFHKYLIEENGEQRESDWEPVSADFYFNNMEFLGMSILTKPYGVFESDRIRQATPPGMAYVGDARYGEWKEDNNGDRFWSWYGKYAFFSTLFFMPPSYYSYNSWHDWDRKYKRKKHYFGASYGGGYRYGTYGSHVKKSPRFLGSAFAKRGGLKAQAPSVRGAGAKIRGGGPKSKGK